MDRYLVWATLLALFFETAWFLNDFKIVEIPFLAHEEARATTSAVGSIQVIKRNVRRRSQESIVWEDSNESDLIYNFDSILTLPESSATINLAGETKITMSENTLILIEPMQKEKDAKIRLRFSKGDINARKLSKATQIQTQDWTVDADAGSEINLRQIDGGKVELEVIKGEANLKGKKEVRAVEEGQMLALFEDAVVEEKKITDDLKWVPENGYRYYFFELPIDATLRWTGEAEKIWHLNAQKEVQWYNVPKGQNELKVKLNSGLHSLRLVNKNKSSGTIAVNVWPAPTLHLLSPLPRDRIQSGVNTTFSWRESPFAKLYKIQLSDKNDFSRILFESKVENSYTNLALKREGQFFWRIQGLDDRGYVIPALYSNPIYNFNELLEAPVIKPPRARQPAAEKPSGAYWWWKMFFPEASAESGYDVIFEWEPVPGAEHYMIEIDKDGTFQRPIVLVKAENSKFMWTGASLGKYYWRVAAGRGDTMGKFSSPQFLDLKKVLEDSRVGEDQGVTVKKSAPAPTPLPRSPIMAKPHHVPPRAVAKPVPPKPLAQVTPPPALAPPPAPVRTINEEEPPVPPPVFKTKWSGGLSIGVMYEYKKLGTTQSTVVTFNDFMPLQIGFNVNAAYEEKREITWRSEFANNTWRPKSDASLPLQGNVLDQNLRNGLYVCDRQSGQGYGLSFSQLSLAKRVGFDQIDLEKQWVFGLGFVFLSHWSSFSMEHSLSVASNFSGRNLYEIYSGNKFIFPMRRLQFIVNTNLFYQFSSQQPDSWGVQVGPALGISW